MNKQTAMRRRFRAPLTGGALLMLAAAGAAAAEVGEVVAAGERWLVAQVESQRRIDSLGDERRSLAEEYRTVLREIEGLNAYNRQLQRQIQLQDDEIGVLDASIAQATMVDRQILPLMLRMADALEQFVALDLPFLPEERAQRLRFVREAIDRVDVSVAEKFRQVLEAYQVELEFGRTIEAYTGSTEIDGRKLEVDFLRVGRIGLYYQTLDGTRSGRWDAKARRWAALPAADRNPLRDAIRVARKLTAPDLLTLPLPTAAR
ncbi:MAG: DUF3450 domain-containing protein [Gammaproteobacteria bacterium]|nr:DUF3450 domain-containing protein [Gammaproteobacteria bacterium]